MKESKQVKKLNLILIIFFFGILVSVDLFLAMPHSGLIEVYDSVPDEVLFYHQAKILSTLMAQGDWHAVFSFGTPYGYGFPFWFTAAVLVHFFPDALTYGIAVHKLAFLMMKWVAFSAVGAVILRRRGAAAASFFCAMVAACSAFFFYGKIFSPEFEMLALASGSIVLLWKDEGRLGIRAVTALCLAFIATAIKLTAFPILLSAISYAFVNYRKRRGLSFAVIPVCLIGLATILFCFVPYMTVAGRFNAASWASLNVGRYYSIKNFMTWFFYRNTTWDVIPLGGAISFLGAIGALIIFSVNMIATPKENCDDKVLAKILGLSALTGFILVVFAEGYFDWYFWIPALMLISATSMSVSFSSFRLKSTALGICALVVLASLPETVRRINMRQEVIAALSDAKSERSNIDEVLSRAKSRCGKPIVVATDFLIALDAADPNIEIFRLRDWATEAIPASSPFFKFRNEFWLPQTFLSDKSKSLAWPSKSQVSHVIVNKRLMRLGLNQFPDIGGLEIMPGGDKIVFGGQTFHFIANFGNSALYEKTSLQCTPPLMSEHRRTQNLTRYIFGNY